MYHRFSQTIKKNHDIMQNVYIILLTALVRISVTKFSSVVMGDVMLYQVRLTGGRAP